MSGFAAGAAIEVAYNAVLIACGTACLRWCRAGSLWGSWAFIFGVQVTWSGALRWWDVAVSDAVAAVFCAWMWHRRHRRDRKRGGSLIGAKSKALIAGLVRRAREASVPRPVLKPVPQGVPA